MRIEAISKPQIAFEDTARADDKAQHTRGYVSILKRSSLLGVCAYSHSAQLILCTYLILTYPYSTPCYI